MPAQDLISAPSLTLPWRKFVDSLQSPFMAMGPDLVIRYCNAAFCRLVNRHLDQVQNRYIFDTFPESEETMRHVRGEFERVLEGSTVVLDELKYDIANAEGVMEARYWRLVNSPLMDEHGNVTHILQQAEDITDALEMKRQRDVISNELDHRVKNLLTVLNAIVSLSGSHCETIPEFRRSLSERLQAISKSHERLARSDWKGLEIADILHDALEPFCDLNAGKVKISGPSLKLGVRSTRDASMVFHEFATNAMKYGFLSDPAGRLEINWEIDAKAGVADFYWREYGLTNIEPPTRNGFGTTLLSSFPNIKTNVDYHPEGWHIHMRMPREILTLEQI